MLTPEEFESCAAYALGALGVILMACIGVGIVIGFMLGTRG